MIDIDHFKSINDRAGHDRRYAIDATKLSNELDWKPKHSEFEDGIRETIEWYEANFEWWESQKTEAENFYLRVAGQS